MIKLFNSLGRKKEEFKPVKEGEASIYSCGPTVYDTPHIGNLRTYIFSDVLRRVLEMNNFKVNQVMNITDVGHLVSDEDEGQDKMEKGAEREKMTVWQIAEKYTQIFKENLKELNIELPETFAKATDNIQEQIDFIKKIEEKGYTYKTSDGIYFDTTKLSDYGILRGGKTETAIGRIETNAEKKNQADFALWKFSPKDEKRQMEWDSPWGIGFPGWHIECSAMSNKYLGEVFDIHTGGVDHIPTHHTNEIAQSEAAFGKIPAHYFLHGEFLGVMGSKMAKSAGTFVTLKDITDKGYEPLAFRYLALTTHYRSKLNFSWESLKSAQISLSNIRKLKNENTDIDEKTEAEIDRKVIDFLDDDLDTPKAIALLHEAGSFKLWEKFENIFALDLDKAKIIPVNIMKLAEERDRARENHDYEKSDKLRKEIEENGYGVEDTVKGTLIT